MSDVFLSYTCSDRNRIKPLVTALEQEGISVWWDQEIPPGKTFAQVIQEELSKSKCVVVVWTRDSIHSEWVETEAAVGKKRGILVPVLLDDVENDIPIEFLRIQAASLKNWNGNQSDPEWRLLLQTISGKVGSSIGSVGPLRPIQMLKPLGPPNELVPPRPYKARLISIALITTFVLTFSVVLYINRPTSSTSMNSISMGSIGPQTSGSIIGKVTYNGPPETKKFFFSKYPNSQFCQTIHKRDLVNGNERLLRTIEVGRDRGLKGAVVAITDIVDQAFMEMFRGSEVVADHCEFRPFTGVVVANQSSFRVINNDADPDDPKAIRGVRHQPHSFEVAGTESRTIFASGLSEKGNSLDKPIRLSETSSGHSVKLTCDQHEFMQSYFFPVTNPYYTVVLDDGSFQISNVPPGRHRLIAWHPFAGRVEDKADVIESGTTQVQLEIRR